MDYQNIPNYVPFAHAKHKIVVVGGFYNGIVQIIFYDEPKFNDTIQLDLGTVTAI